jgi:hypothetical protein
MWYMAGLGCLATPHERFLLWLWHISSAMEAFMKRLSNLFFYFTGVFSMGNKDSEALWVVGGYHSKSGESGYRKSYFCPHIHHSVLSEVWSEDHSIGK